MKYFKPIFFISLLLQTVAPGQSQPKKTKFDASKQASLKRVFHNMVGKQTVVLDSNYITTQGDTFSVSKFKYYVGNFEIDCSNKIESKYYLIDQQDSNSQQIKIGTCDGLNKISFSLGVDSIHNVSGIQTGALDPANAMFWTWNSGYIMAKLEGKSPQSKAPFRAITYHIGGFRQKENVVKKIVLPLVNKDADVALTHHSPLTTHQMTIHINVDISKWFDGPHPIHISEHSFCMSPGPLAMQIADNYADMFSIEKIEYK